MSRFALIGLLSLCAGCLQMSYTGEVGVYPVRPISSPFADFGVPDPAFTELRADDGHHVRRPYLDRKLVEDNLERTLQIRINRGFVRHLADLGPNKEVLAFVEVTDHADGKTYKRVFFEEEFAAEGAYLNFSNVTVYGPRVHQGYPLTVRFFIVELDQKENAIALEAVSQIKQTVALTQHPVDAAASGLLFDVIATLIRANIDDREFNFTIQLNPATTVQPDGVDWRTAGVLLQPGNYVVIKREFQRLGVDPAAMIDFEDEFTWPLWTLGGAPTLKDAATYAPNIVYLGGQLYAQRAYLEVLDEARARGLAGLFGGYPASARRQRLAMVERLRAASDRAQRAAVRKVAGGALTPESGAPPVRTDDDESATRPVERSVLNEALGGVYDEADALKWLRKYPGTNAPRPGEGRIIDATPSGEGRIIDAAPPTEVIPPDRDSGDSDGARRDDAAPPGDVLGPWLLSLYQPYDSKSYITFTVSDGSSPGVTEVLEAAEAADAARIGQVRLSISEAEATAAIRELGGTARTALVQRLARQSLSGARSKRQIEERAAKLKQQFGDAYGADIDRLVAERTEQIDLLKRFTGVDPEQQRAEFRKGLEGLLPVLKQVNPSLATVVENLLKQPETAGDGN